MVEGVEKPGPAKWDAHKTEISNLYRAGYTQTRIRKLLALKYNFIVSSKQLEYRLKLWELRKNIKQSEYQLIHNALRNYADDGEGNGDIGPVYVGGTQVPAEKLKRNLNRHTHKRPRIEAAHTESARNSVPDIEIYDSSTGRRVLNSVAIADRVAAQPSNLVQFKRKRQISISSDSDSDARREPRPTSANPTRYFACPFAKAYPRDFQPCIPIHRQNLAGIKEHLKRRHFGKGLNEKFNRDVRDLKTWQDIFSYLLPDWVGPKPSADFDILNAYRSITRSPSPIISQVGHPTNRVEISPPVEEVSNTAQDEESEGNIHRINSQKSSMELQKSRGITETRDLGGLVTADSSHEDLRRRIDRMGEILDSISRSPNITTIETIDSTLPEAQEQLGLAGESNSLATATYVPASPGRALPREDEDTPMRNYVLQEFIPEHAGNPRTPPKFAEASRGPDRIASNNRDYDLLGIGGVYQTSPMPRQTPLKNLHNIPDEPTCDYERQSIDKSAANRASSNLGDGYLLQVARKPAPRNSLLESPRPKKFYFHNFEDFEAKFEPWMSRYFCDPPFRWDEWVLEDARRKSLMLSVADVRDELEFTFEAIGSRRAALYLVPIS